MSPARPASGAGGPALAPPRFLAKICGLADFGARVAALPRPLVFTNGVFDILHSGHVSYLDQAATLGASLVVGVNTDESVRRLAKGPERPLNALADRMAVLAALESVRLVIPFAEDNPVALIGAVRPELIVKGGDYDMDVLPETALVRSWGGDALAIPLVAGRSTTSLVERIRGG